MQCSFRPGGPARVIQGRFAGNRPVFRPGGHGPAVQAAVRGHAVEVPPALDLLARSLPGQPLPPAVQARMEQHFGTSFADVRVHVGPQPAAIGALAFTTGSSIYFAPGQYQPHSVHGLRLLGHELAHVVQQRAGRVPSPFPQGLAVVQHPGLEAEAERMSVLLAMTPPPRPQPAPPPRVPAPPAHRPPAPHVQAALQMRPAAGAVPPAAKTQASPPAAVPARTSPVVQPADKRPSFISNSKQSAFLAHNLLSGHSFEVNLRRPRLTSYNAAMPHRMSWADIRKNTNWFYDGEDDEDDFRRWTDRFLSAGRRKIRETDAAIEEAEDEDDEDRVEDLKELRRRQKSSQRDFEEARDELIAKKSSGRKKEFLRQANSFHANVPDLGPHFGVNNPVRERTHLHFRRSRSRKRRRSPSPMSRRVLDMSPERLSGIAVDDDDRIITTTGETVKPKRLGRKVRRLLSEHDLKEVSGYDADYEFG